MKIAVCDDDLLIRNEMKYALTNYFSEKLINTKIVDFDNGEDLINSDISFDMAFLDVEMPMLDGIETGKALKQKNPNIVIFMITAFSDYLDDAFEIGAYRFLQKPLDVLRLYRSLDSALISMSSKDVKVICANNESVIIPTGSIVYCESYKRKTKIVTTNGEYISKEKIDYWKEILNELIFYSPHSSFIINFNYIKSFNRKSLILSYSNSNIEISVAAKKQQEFRTKIFLFAERGM
jgi:two-component system LytT family response regulator